MLVLLGPPFQGTDADYGRLARITGMVAYDLRTRLKPGVWGVVRALADPGQARALVELLVQDGFRACAVDPGLGHDPARAIVALRGLEIGESELVLHLRERAMSIPIGALLTIIRGEVQIGASAQAARSGSSATFRAVVPTGSELAALREQVALLDAYAAADIHFVTVMWAARIDVRSFDFSILGQANGSAQDLDRLVDHLAERAGVRVDRASRISSVVSFAGAAPLRATTPMPGSPPIPRGNTERFDFYSRVIAEAERAAHGAPPPSSHGAGR
jgi:hypothetical protein